MARNEALGVCDMCHLNRVQCSHLLQWDVSAFAMASSVFVLLASPDRKSPCQEHVRHDLQMGREFEV